VLKLLILLGGAMLPGLTMLRSMPATDSDWPCRDQRPREPALRFCRLSANISYRIEWHGDEEATACRRADSIKMRRCTRDGCCELFASDVWTRMNRGRGCGYVVVDVKQHRDSGTGHCMISLCSSFSRRQDPTTSLHLY
jgi:hypothetical protein